MRVTGIRSGRSTGIVRYCAALAEAIAAHGVGYDVAALPRSESLPHWHLGNSSRAGVALAPWGRPYAVTVHDVIPRTPALRHVYRSVVYPGIVAQGRRVIVHSRYAADLLARVSGLDVRRLEVIPHGARPRISNRVAARSALGWSPDERIAVLPGAIRGAKLVALAVEAAAPLMRQGRWRLALVGRLVDHSTARAASELGAIVLSSPEDDAYDDAIAAADAVLVLRSGSVGETNGPLLDSFGAGRAVVATSVGSLPELAAGAAALTDPDPRSIRAALEELEDDGSRADREALSAARGRVFAWPGVAEAHRAVFDEVAGA